MEFRGDFSFNGFRLSICRHPLADRTIQYTPTHKQTQNSGHSSTGKLKLKLGGGHCTQYGTHTHIQSSSHTFLAPITTTCGVGWIKTITVQIYRSVDGYDVLDKRLKQVRAIIARIDAIYEANWRKDGNNLTSRIHKFVMRNLFRLI